MSECVCGHGANTTHQQGVGACIGYTKKRGAWVKCRCGQYQGAVNAE